MNAPTAGMLVTFKPKVLQSLSSVHARVVKTWLYESNDYLVTLEYPEPVRYGSVSIRHIDAFLSQLDIVSRQSISTEVEQPNTTTGVYE